MHEHRNRPHREQEQTAEQEREQELVEVLLAKRHGRDRGVVAGSVRALEAPAECHARARAAHSLPDVRRSGHWRAV